MSDVGKHGDSHWPFAANVSSVQNISLACRVKEDVVVVLVSL